MSRMHQPDQGKFHAIHPEDVRWESFAAFPPAARLAILIGDPTKPAEQFELLRTLNCDQSQGYFHCRPVPAQEIDQLLADDR